MYVPSDINLSIDYILNTFFFGKKSVQMLLNLL